MAPFLLSMVAVTASLFCTSTTTDDLEAPAPKTIGVLVADDHDIVCAGIERMIAGEPDMEVRGTAQSGTETVEKARRLRPRRRHRRYEHVRTRRA